MATLDQKRRFFEAVKSYNRGALTQTGIQNAFDWNRTTGGLGPKDFRYIVSKAYGFTYTPEVRNDLVTLGYMKPVTSGKSLAPSPSAPASIVAGPTGRGNVPVSGGISFGTQSIQPWLPFAVLGAIVLIILGSGGLSFKSK